MWATTFLVPNAYPAPVSPERWRALASGLFRANARVDVHEWADICETRWANPATEHASFQLINWTVNHSVGELGVRSVIDKLQRIVAPLHEAGQADRSDTSSIYASSSNSTAGFNSPLASPRRPVEQGPPATNIARPRPPGPRSSSSLRSSAHRGFALAEALVGPTPVGSSPSASSSRQYPFEDDWETVHHPCVIHLQGVPLEACRFLIEHEWIKRQFSIAPGMHNSEDGSGFPSGARYGNVTLVSHALAVPTRPYIVHFQNSHPSVCAHALFVTIRVCLSNGQYRHVLLCNSALEPGSDDRLREQYEQMRAVAFHLSTQHAPESGSSGIRQSAGIFCGTAKRGVRDPDDSLTLVDATERLRYTANGRILHTAPDDLRMDIGTVGVGDNNRPGGLVAKIWFEEDPLPFVFQPEWK